MKPLVLALGAGLLALAATSSFAASAGTSVAGDAAAPVASPAASAPSQKNKMKTCNADAAGKHGDERRAFMKQCLSKKPVAAVAG